VGIPKQIKINPGRKVQTVSSTGDS